MTTSATPAKGLRAWFRRLLESERPPPKKTAAASGKARPAGRPNPAAIVVEEGDGDDANGEFQEYCPQETADAWRAYCPEIAAYAEAIGLGVPELPTYTREQQTLSRQLIASLSAEEVQKDDSLGSAPTHALQVLKLVSRLDLEASELTTAVKHDPAITTAVLHAANAAAVAGAGGPIDSVRDAIVRIGVFESARIAGAVAAQTLFSPGNKLAQALFGARLSELHVGAASVAFGAAKLSMELNKGRADLAYLSGMLLEVGKTLALGKLSQMIESNAAPREIDPLVLDRVLEAVHVELGVLAHRTWKLPEHLTAACENQNEPILPHDAAHTEQHLVRVVSGLFAMRERTQPPARAARVADSMTALEIRAAQARALDTTLRERAKLVRSVLVPSRKSAS